MAKVVIWGFSTIGTEEQKSKLHSLTQEYGYLNFEFGKNKNLSELSNCYVLIKHDNDIPDIQDLSSVQWTVICSGNITTPKINKAKRTVGIPPNTLVENLDFFLEVVKNKNNIELEDIEILFSIDPELEGLLDPFSVADPYTDNVDLRQKKEKLQGYINELLSK